MARWEMIVKSAIRQGCEIFIGYRWSGIDPSNNSAREAYVRVDIVVFLFDDMTAI
jgi:hypothetical protein